MGNVVEMNIRVRNVLYEIKETHFKYECFLPICYYAVFG